MKKYAFFSTLPLLLCLLTIGNFAKAAKDIKVEIHTVKGSGITEQQVRDWIKKTNQADSNHANFVVDSNHLYEPNTPYDPKKNDANKVNIWVRKSCAVTGEPNYVSGQKGNIIELVPGKKPAGPNDPNVFIKDSTLAHELNHFLGLEHSNDPNNKMYPDNSSHGGTKPIHSCHRIGIQVTPAQFTTIDATVTKLANKATERGKGKDMYDYIGDVSFNYIDLDWSQAWLEWSSGMYLLNLIAQVREISFIEFSQIAYYINADNDPATGQPPEGLDYYIAYQPNINQVIFQMYDGTLWLPLNPLAINYTLMYTEKDLDEPLVASGVKLTVPIPLLPLAMGQNFISLKSIASNIAETDFLPDAGLATFEYPPQWPCDFVPDGQIDFRDLRVLTNSWLEPPPDSDIDLYYDGIINFRDFADFANSWRQISH